MHIADWKNSYVPIRMHLTLCIVIETVNGNLETKVTCLKEVKQIMSDKFPSEGPLLIIPLRQMPNTRRARFAPFYKGGFAALFLLFTFWNLIQQLIIRLNFHGNIPSSLQSFLDCAMWGCGIATMAACYLIIDAGTDAILRDTFLRPDPQQLQQLTVKFATRGRLWWYGPHDYFTYVPSLSTLLEQLQVAVISAVTPDQEMTVQKRILFPVKKVILSLSQTLTLLLIGQNETRVTFTLELHKLYAAFILYLVMTGRKAWVLTKNIHDHVYYHFGRSYLNTYARRLLKAIDSATRNAGLEPFPLYESSKDSPDGKGIPWSWRFTIQCHFEDVDDVYAWSDEINSIRAGITDPLSVEVLTQRATQVMAGKSEQNLIPLFNHPAYEMWIEPAVFEVVRRRLLIVEHTAQRVFKERPANAVHEKASLSMAAECYEWCMCLAMTVLHDLRFGQHYRQLCVQMLRLLHDNEAIVRIDELFGKLEREIPKGAR